MTSNSQLYDKSIDYIKSILRKYLSANSQVYLFGSRANNTATKQSDIDIGIIDSNLDRRTIVKIKTEIAESFVPYHVDIVDFAKTDEDFRKKALSNSIVWNIN